MFTRSDVLAPQGLIARGKRLLQHAHVNWALADQAIVSGASFLATVFIARFLGIEELGRFALAWLAVYFVQNFQIAMIVAPMMTIGAKQPPEERRTYIGALLVQQAVFAVVTSALVLIGTLIVGRMVPAWDLGPLAVPLTALVFFGQLSDFLRRYFFAFDRPCMSVLVDGIRYGTQTALLLIVLVWTSATTATALVVMTVAAVVAVLVGSIGFGRATFRASVIWDVTKRHWSFSRWLTVGAVAQWSRENFVHAAVGAVLGLAELGALRAGQQLVRTVNVAIQALDNFAPMRAGLSFAHRGFAGLLNYVSNFLLQYMLAILAALVVIALLGETLLTLVYGPDYGGHGYVVAGYAIVMAIYLIRHCFSTILRAMETTSFEFYASIAGTVFVAAAAHPLVSHFGMRGALLCLALFESLIAAILFIGVFRRRRVEKTRS